MPGRSSVADARDTHVAIVRRAADVASVEGLGGLTIGRLASDVGMSKAGVLGQFGSKEALQLETLDYAVQNFRERVWKPAEHVTAGLPRLLAICQAWARHVLNPPFAGGCFISAASFEYDSREGKVHDVLKQATRLWRNTLVGEIRIAVGAGDLPADTDADQLAFTIESLAAGANPARYLQGDQDIAARCLRAMHAAIGVPGTMIHELG